MTPGEKVRRLRDMLGQLAHDRGAKLEELVEAGPTLEVLQTGGMESIQPPTALQKLARDEALDSEEVDGLEAIILPLLRPVAFVQGNTYTVGGDWVHLNAAPIKQRLEPLLPSIGRIELPTNPLLPYGGTGFIVGRDLVMTNRHVAKIFSEGVGSRTLVFRHGDAAIDFDREQPLESPDSLLLVRDVVMIHPYWDMALLRVDGLAPDRAPLTLSVKAPEDLDDNEIAVVGYPARDGRNDLGVQDTVFGKTYFVKRFQPGKIRKRASIVSFETKVDAMVHDASTLGGNSGSAVIEIATGHVVGLHFAGVYLKANYCVPMYELARDPRVVATGLNFAGGVAASDQTDAAWRRVSEETTVSVSAAVPVSAPTAQVAQLTIPLQITISIGTPVVAQPQKSELPKAVNGSPPSFPIVIEVAGVSTRLADPE
ncbi:MAG: serine protease [Kofleriaceae bacterium]